jgi:UDP-N-acetylmuramate--alanine ligase
VTAWAGRRLHFVGIGGAGMSGLALVARTLGAEVTGSDRADSPYCEPLRAAGIEPVVGHAAANVPEGAEVVYSTAVPADNPERTTGAPELHRADLLAQLTRLKPCIAISGTHGKTTTTAMAAHVLIEARREPSYLIGGELRTTGLNAEWRGGEWLVVEADESDRSFLKLDRRVAVVTNSELDHHSTYLSELDILRAYSDFAKPAERVIAGEGVDLGLTALTFGVQAGDLAAEDVRLGPDGARFTAGGARFALRVPGRHNVLNALAAAAACREAGVSLADSAEALASFPGVARRFEWRGRSAAGAAVYDDYAHHPTEVRATLEAARTLGAERVVACFQPHLFSRTRALAREFGAALAVADLVCVLDVYPARERPEEFPGVSGWLVAAAAADAAAGRPVYWTPGMDDAERLLGAELREGDLLLTLGAGNVDALAGRLARAEVPA